MDQGHSLLLLSCTGAGISGPQAALVQCVRQGTAMPPNGVIHSEYRDSTIQSGSNPWAISCLRNAVVGIAPVTWYCFVWANIYLLYFLVDCGRSSTALLRQEPDRPSAGDDCTGCAGTPWTGEDAGARDARRPPCSAPCRRWNTTTAARKSRDRGHKPRIPEVVLTMARGQAQGPRSAGGRLVASR
mmetsp:Transcript_47208/g.77609  ORF Transcript_47208/g.77609 Transcript_47208/m.77609 type:complete len:186 (+) Transcript_47208:1035-1592(+)